MRNLSSRLPYSHNLSRPFWIYFKT